MSINDIKKRLKNGSGKWQIVNVPKRQQKHLKKCLIDLKA